MLAFLPGCSFVLFIFFIIFHTIIHFLWSIWLNKSTLPLSFFFWSPTPFRERVWNRLYQSYLMWISQPFLVRWSMRVRSHTIKSFSRLPSFAIFPWFPMFVGINKLFWEFKVDIFLLPRAGFEPGTCCIMTDALDHSNAEMP